MPPNLSSATGDQLVLALLIALLGWCAVMFGHWVHLRVADGVERGHERDRAVEMLRWATELATAGNVIQVRAGLAALDALSGCLDSDRAPELVAEDVLCSIRATGGPREAPTSVVRLQRDAVGRALPTTRYPI